MDAVTTSTTTGSKQPIISNRTEPLARSTTDEKTWLRTVRLNHSLRTMTLPTSGQARSRRCTKSAGNLLMTTLATNCAPKPAPPNPIRNNRFVGEESRRMDRCSPVSRSQHDGTRSPHALLKSSLLSERCALCVRPEQSPDGFRQRIHLAVDFGLTLCREDNAVSGDRFEGIEPGGISHRGQRQLCSGQSPRGAF